MTGNNGNENLRTGVYVCHCGSNIAGVISPSEAGERSSNEGGRKWLLWSY
jgi:hypothetical protein